MSFLNKLTRYSLLRVMLLNVSVTWIWTEVNEYSNFLHIYARKTNVLGLFRFYARTAGLKEYQTLQELELIITNT